MSYTVSVLSLVLVIANLYLKLPYASLLKNGFKTNDSNGSLKTVTSNFKPTNLTNGIKHRRSNVNYLNSYGGALRSASILNELEPF